MYQNKCWIWAISFSLATTKEMSSLARHCFIFHQVLKCFTSLGMQLVSSTRYPTKLDGFPHSEISGSKVAKHLPEAYRSFTTSFIAY